MGAIVLMTPIGKLTKALSSAQVVMQTQHNYERDLLDSDDYYQFEGGLNAAVRCMLIMLILVVSR